MSNEIRSILKTCSICKESFPTLRDLIEHEKIHRRQLSNVPVSLVNPLPQLRSVSFVFSATATSQAPTSSNDTFCLYDSWRCPDCQALLSSRELFHRHRKKWHRESADQSFFGGSNREERIASVWRYRCRFCFAMFAKKKPFYEHLSLHKKNGDSQNFPAIDQKSARSTMAGVANGRSTGNGGNDAIKSNRGDLHLDHSGKSISDNGSSSDGNTYQSPNREPDPYPAIESVTDETPDIKPTIAMEETSKMIGDQPQASRDSKLRRSILLGLVDATDRSLPGLEEIPSPSVKRRKSTPGSGWFCKYCLGTFVERHGLRVHESRHHYTSDGKLIYYCSICYYRSTNRRYLSSEVFLEHALKKHRIDPQSSVGGKPPVPIQSGTEASGKSNTSRKSKKQKLMDSDLESEVTKDGGSEGVATAWEAIVKTEPDDNDEEYGQASSSITMEFVSVKEECME